MKLMGDSWQLLERLAERWSGFSLERRQEWPQPWRARIIPNSQKRLDYRLEAFGSTPEEALRHLAGQALGVDERFRAEMQRINELLDRGRDDDNDVNSRLVTLEYELSYLQEDMIEVLTRLTEAAEEPRP